MIKINKNIALQFLSKTLPQKAFWSSDGKIFHNIVELGAGLKRMNAGAFSYHANANKNDFSKWIADVFGDDKLAEELLKAKNKADAAKKVWARIAYLKKFVK